MVIVDLYQCKTGKFLLAILIRGIKKGRIKSLFMFTPIFMI